MLYLLLFILFVAALLIGVLLLGMLIWKLTDGSRRSIPQRRNSSSDSVVGYVDIGGFL